jgi:hypothetical protein
MARSGLSGGSWFWSESSSIMDDHNPHPIHAPGPFDFTRAMWLLCRDISRRMDEFSHVRMGEVAVSFAQARRNVTWGLQAKLTPLRFAHGRLQESRGGRLWTIQRLHHGRREMLYILTFYLPRFLETPFEEKLTTVFHELYHISPAFDGDIRRLAGRCHVHSESQQEYDRQMAIFARQWLDRNPPRELYGFLRHRFATLQEKYGGVMGLQLPIPKLIPVEKSRSA